jgi:cardiolipin synthase A/B
VAGKAGGARRPSRGGAPLTTLLLTQFPVWAGVVLVLYWIAALIFLVDQDREPTSTLAWLFVLVFLPFIGILFYYFFGRDWHERTPSSKWASQCVIDMKRGMAPIYARNLTARTRFQDIYAGSWVEDISAAIAADDFGHPLPASSVEIYGRTADFFSRLRRDLAAARSFIHLQYFIWEMDELTAEITGILLERVAAGVEVRILYDNLGSRRYGKDELRRLAQAGAHVTADVVERAHLNYRDHRKVAVIDGEIGYTGGSNMGQEYIDGGKRFSVWRDTNVRITGQAVAGLQKLFASRWYVDHKGEDLLVERYLPGPDGAAAADGHLTQLVAHTHEGRWQASRRAHMIAIAKAEKSAYIQSPYFIPDAGMYDAMINAGLSGVDIRFMMAGVPDRRVPFWAAQTYFGRLLSAGVRVYLYEAGFSHAKTITVDSTVGAVGTMNMDIRSMHLHKELMLWLFDQGLTRQLEALFMDDVTRCHEVTLDDVRAVSRRERFRNQGCRLLSNLL